MAKRKVKKSPKKRASKFAAFDATIKKLSKDKGRDLEDLGFKHLDGGAFAAVYTHPKLPDMVVKDTGSSDKWTKYARAVMTKKNHNPAVPKIHRYRAVGNRRLALMERLDGAFSLEGLDEVEDYVRGGGNISDLPTWVDKNFRKALDVVKQIKKKHKYKVSIDIHSRNIMMRGDQYVLTDPLA